MNWMKWVAVVFLAWLLGFGNLGCSQMNAANVKLMTDFVKALDARGSAAVHDPAFELYVEHRTAIGMQLKGVNGQGSGQGEPEEGEGDGGS